MIMVALVALLASIDGGALGATATDPKKRAPVIVPPPVLPRVPVLQPLPPILVPPAPPASYVPGNRYPQPRGNRAAWVTADDYPSSAMREEIEGLVEVELSIGTTGRAVACGIRQSPNAPALEEQNCRTLMRRARFNPATDANGRPVIGTFTSRIRWELPDDPLLPLPDGSPAPVVKRDAPTMTMYPLARPTVDLATLVTADDHPDAALAVRRGGLVSVRLSIDASGAVGGCVPVWVYLELDLSQKACALFTERARFEPAIGDDGVPIASTLFASHFWVPFPAPLPMPLPPSLPPTSN